METFLFSTHLDTFILQYAPPLRLPPNSMVEDDKVALIMPDQVSPSQTPSPLPALFTLSQVCPCFFLISNFAFSVLDFVFLYVFLQLMAAIPRADIYFRINEKLSSLGSLQYSKYVFYKTSLADFQFILLTVY